MLKRKRKEKSYSTISCSVMQQIYLFICYSCTKIVFTQSYLKLKSW